MRKYFRRALCSNAARELRAARIENYRLLDEMTRVSCLQNENYNTPAADPWLSFGGGGGDWGNYLGIPPSKTGWRGIDISYL